MRHKETSISHELEWEVVAMYVRLTQTSDIRSGKFQLRDWRRLDPIRPPQLGPAECGKVGHI
jgi:hypothetical protein